MSLSKLHNEKVRPLLDAVDKLRDILSGEPIQLPTIVVIGDQSSGKSSVLESLSGINLPRGQNIVTRCPLVLRMNNISNQNEEYALIGTPDHQTKIELEDIERHVAQITKEIAGSGQAISSKPISLTVYRRNCPDLTLVDLPGITRNPVGDQPKNIYNQIRNLIETYITPEESVILCVVPSNVDFVTSEAIMLAREVDQKGVRTIGVITKIDKCEKGIRAKLEGTGEGNLALALGYVAVRNRTQDEIDGKLPFEVTRKKEWEFFQNHPELSEMAPSYLGTEQLAMKLTNIQLQRIQSTLPKVCESVENRLLETRDRLAKLPVPPTSTTEYRLWFQDRLAQCVSQLGLLLRGLTTLQGDKSFNAPARLQEAYEGYDESVRKIVPNFLGREFHATVLAAMDEAKGVTLANFLSHPTFALLIHTEARKLKLPSLKLIQTVFNSHKAVMDKLVRDYFGEAPRLCNKILQNAHIFVEECRKDAVSRIEEQLAREEEDIFTLNGIYMDTITKIKAKLTEANALAPVCVVNDDRVDLSFTALAQPSSQAKAACEMQISLYAYWRVVQRRVCDVIPMTLRAQFDRKIMESMQSKLNREMDTNVLEAALKDNFQGVIEQREKLEASCKRLEQAMKVMSEL